MKKALALFLLAATTSAFSQGQVVFNNKASAFEIDAPISYSGGGPVPAGLRPDPTVDIPYGPYHFGGINAMAGLYYGVPGTAENQLAILVPAVPFRSGIAAGYVDAGTAARIVDGIPIGAPAIFQVRSWDTGTSRAASYEEAVSQINAQGIGYYGVGNIISIPSLGGPPYPPSVLLDAQPIGMQPLGMQFVPEPSVIGLGLLGAAAGIVVFRRRE